MHLMIEINEDVLFWSLVYQARAIKEGVIKSRELLELIITQIDRVSQKINAISNVDYEGARLGTDAAYEMVAAGEIVDPLHGLHFTVKNVSYTHRRASIDLW
jgi:Asp-tRNA(Asn)/Glu-tRNA(Gln) amidotransferase A subunit family amidase